MKTKKYWILAVVTAVFIPSIWLCIQGVVKAEQSVEDKKNENQNIINTTDKFVSIDVSKIKFVGKGRDTLVGLPGVHVLVEEINPEAQKYGLTKQALQTDVELQLRRYGIKVISEEEMLRTKGMPYLYIRLNCVIRDPSSAISIEVKLEEIALLTTRYPVMACSNATTWEKCIVAIVGVLKIETVREDVRDLVNEFINDYLAANPKKEPVEKKPKEEDNTSSVVPMPAH
jgi:hypothetical protein